MHRNASVFSYLQPKDSTLFPAKQILSTTAAGQTLPMFPENRLPPTEWFRELESGGRVVVFEYCISFVFITLRRTSHPCLLQRGQWGWLRGLPYVVGSLLLGWWGLPWGPILTPVTILTNLGGGRDITAAVRQQLECQTTDQ